jgi:hypothetical protein
MILAAPLVAQRPDASPWTFSVNAGPGLGGPVGQLRDRLVAEQWTDQYCDYRRSDCHRSPTTSGVRIQVSGALARRISDRLEVKTVVEVGDLGQVIGAKGQYEIKANWKTATLGTALMLHPVSRVRIGAGPLVAMLTRQAVPPQNNNPIRLGMLFEGGLRSSERNPTFVELVLSYRLLPRLPEGPWPGNGQSSQIASGPSGINADFSHLTVGVGAGVRF